MAGDDLLDAKDDVSHVPLWALLPTEWLCGVTSAALMSPFVSIIDTSISANAGGVSSLKDAMKSGFSMLFKSPQKFLKWRPFHVILGVYGSTYFVANTVEAVCERAKTDPFYYKFVFTSITNVLASVYKEMEFTRMFSTAVPRPLPITSAFLFCGRDSLTILASFNLPTVMSKKLQQHYHISPRVADVSSQLTLPCAVQFLSTPLYLLGSHLYNFPDATVPMRAQFVSKKYFGTAMARVARIFPAFGVGGVANKLLRGQARSVLATSFQKPA